MEVKNVNSQTFTGLFVSKPAQKALIKIYRDEINNAQQIYRERLLRKNYRSAKSYLKHDEKIFRKSFDLVWDRLDAYDAVRLKYMDDKTSDMFVRMKDGKLMSEIVTNNNGQKIVTDKKVFSNKEELFGFIQNQYYKILKNKK